MAAAQKVESGAALRAASLFGVFVVAKCATLAGRELELSGWAVVAYFWQDALVALLCALLDRAVRRPWFGWGLYTACVAYAALNVPVARVLSSPLTRPMLRAAGGALSDSVRHHATAGNLAGLMLVLVAGVILPRLLPRPGWKLALPLLVLIPLGPAATARVETIGRHRNALAALLTPAGPQPLAGAGEDGRASPFGEGTGVVDLSGWRGSAAGRNVVLVLLESTGAGYLRPYGAARDPMPRLTALAREAVVFERAYTVYPESVKTLFSVLCARYPALGAGGGPPAGTPSLAAALRVAGYRTALFHSGRFIYLGMEAVVADRGFDVLEDAGAIGGERESSFGVDEPSAVGRMLAWVDALPRGGPFFLTYLPIAGHHPYDTPVRGPFPDVEEADRYLNALHYADSALGALLDGLRARGLAGRTLFVILGDHGEAFGQHEGNYGHSLFLYEENIHVPYLIAAPGLITEQVRVGRAASLVDTAPTILDLLGLPRLAGGEGESLLDGKERMALFHTDYSLTLSGLRDGCWKYIYESGTGREKLFDLCSDPGERRNLAALDPERAAIYRSRLMRPGNGPRMTRIGQISKD